MAYDAVIIGAGVVGCLTARELAKYDIKVALVEKNNDVAMATTKANSGIVHAGFDARPGTVKARLNVQGCEMMEETCSTLFVAYKKTGSLVIAIGPDQEKTLKDLYDRGIKNGVKGMEIIDQKKVREMEPNISPDVTAALYAPTAGVVSPYDLAIAAAECAVGNGVEYFRNYNVKKIEKPGEFFIITPENGDPIEARYIINCAGLYSQEIAKMIGDESIHLIGRLGEYGLLDKNCGKLVNNVIFQCPTEMGKGILVTQTAHGNILVGPTSVDVQDKDDTSVRASALNEVFKTAQKSVPSVSIRDMITSFAGIRAHDESSDFIIGPSDKDPSFINAAGIESPGLAASPAIALELEKILIEQMGSAPAKKQGYSNSRKKPVHFASMSNDERLELIKKDPAYARIVCRCETVTEGEIRDAIKAPAGARDVDGVKRRTRAGMGRCQGGFCGSKVMEILSNELGLSYNQIQKFGDGSDIIYERTK
jgi:glycerol-3-phosphate dehydrogenase